MNVKKELTTVVDHLSKEGVRFAVLNKEMGEHLMPNEGHFNHNQYQTWQI